jgi:PBP1b-binding outer membrane lipoprotein LpoB
MDKKTIVVLCIAFLMAGCAKEQVIKVEYRDVKVEVPVVPQPPVVNPPEYTLPKLTPTDRADIGIVSQALVVDTKLRDGYIKILETIINTYKKYADNSGAKTTLEVPGLNDKEEAPKP